MFEILTFDRLRITIAFDQTTFVGSQQSYNLIYY